MRYRAEECVYATAASAACKMRSAFVAAGVAISSVAAQAPFPVVTPTQLRQLLQRQGDTLVVVNLWATWCTPCLAELPLFDSLARRYVHLPVRVWLVNVDSRARRQQVLRFLARRRFQAHSLLLSYGRGDRWMDTVHPEWSGTLPATLFWRVTDSLSSLVEGEWTAAALEEHVQQYLRPQ